MQQVKRIGVFTKHSMQPRHPRIQMELDILKAEGYEVELHCNPDNWKGNHGGLWNKIRYYFSLTYFHWPLIDKFKGKLVNYDAVLLYDFALLPLVKRARKLGKHVVYETIDNNVTYTFHSLVKRMPIFRFLEGYVTGRMKRLEQRYSRDFAHKVIVNGQALKNYIGTPNIIMMLYASPFEQVKLDSSQGKDLAYLYLGEFTEDKGGELMLDIAGRSGRPFLIYGFVKEAHLKERIAAMPNVFQKDRMNIGDLQQELLSESKRYRFAGFSLIKPVHLSFATQEANKDIDYMALGIPIVANERGITKEKVDAGCGVMYNDEVAMLKIGEDEDFYNRISERCLTYYSEFYSKAAFIRGLLAAFDPRS